jgi:peroxiredoxin
MKNIKLSLIPAIAGLLLTSGLRADGPSVPRHAPEFVLNLPDGSTKLLSSYRGKVIVVAFLHTTCPHCQNCAQVFSKLYDEFGSKGFQPIGVAWNDMAKMLVPDFVRMFHVNFPVAYADKDPVFEFLQFSPMKRTVVPQIVWIDRKGMIRSQTEASSSTDETMRKEPYWREMIVKLIAEPVTEANARTVVPVRRASK